MNNHGDAQPAAKDRILLSSLADFWSVLEPLLSAARARNICEIGLGEGEFTATLIDYCKTHSGHYTGIDPQANAARTVSATATVIPRPSLAALPELAAQDVYFLDGDHNYHTVRNELRLILETPVRWPLVILHDVGWPWGRRDQYCDPEKIPESARHAHSTDLSVMPGRSELGSEGFSGTASDYPYATANHEGGPRNGVLTAVEDFLHEPAGREWRLLVIPAVFGLGILYAPEKLAEPTRRELDRLERSMTPLYALLEKMERNRVDLVLAYLRHISQLGAAHSEYQKLHLAYEQLDRHARDLLLKYEELMGKYGELRTHTDSLQAACEKLQHDSKASKKGR